MWGRVSVSLRVGAKERDSNANGPERPTAFRAAACGLIRSGDQKGAPPGLVAGLLPPCGALAAPVP